MEYRVASHGDFAQLAALRWESRTEDGGEQPAVSRDEFVRACAGFFRQGLKSGDQAHWVALDGSEIVAHISILRVPMVPRPCKVSDCFGYISDNYTRPAYRGRGIGSELLARATQWARDEDLELLIVWPSGPAVSFYERAGFRSDNDVMELVLRDYYSPEWAAGQGKG